MFDITKKIILVALVTIFTISCSDDSSSNPVEETTITPAYDVEYNDNTIIINDDSNDLIIGLDTATSTYTLDGGRFSEDPEVGEVILVEGKLLRKVKSVSRNGGNLVVETEDAALTDAIQNGEIAWDVTPEWSNATSLKFDGVTVMTMPTQFNEKIEHTITYGGIDHKIEIEPKLVDGKINSCDFTFVMAKKIAGDATAAFTAKGTVKLPSQSTLIKIKEGKLDKFKSFNKGITADLELSLSAAGSKSGNHSLELPGIALSIPIRFIPTPSGPIPLPIPVSIDIGIQFVTQMSIPDVASSATATSKLSLTADGDFEYTGASIKTEGKFGKDQITDGEFDAAANIGFPIDVQFGVAFPRVGLNIAGQELAYIHTGFTTGSSLKWGPVCKSGYVKMVVEGGYELKVLGQTIAKKKEVFAESKKEAKGEGCQ
jgi:hypothetical protein